MIGACGIAILSVPSAQALAITWTGAGTDGTCGGNAGDGNKWSCATNWSTGTVPTTGDAITFNGTSTKNASVDTGFVNTITSLTIASGYTGTITLANNLTMTGAFSIAAGTFSQLDKTLTIGSTFTQTGGTFSVSSGTTTIASNFNLSAGAYTATSGNTTVNGAFTVSGAPTFAANGGRFTFGTNGTLTCVSASLPLFSAVTLNNSAGTLTVGANCSLPLGADPTMGGAGSVAVSGIVSGSGTLTKSSATLTLSSGSSLSGFSGLSLVNLTVGGGNINLASYSPVSVSSTLTETSGTLTLPTTFSVPIFTLSGGTLNPGSGMLTVTSNLTISGTPTISSVFGTINFGGAGATINCGAVDTFLARLTLVTFTNTTNKAVQNCSTGSNPAGLPLGNNPTISNSVTLTSGTLSGTGTLTQTAGTLVFGGGTLSGFTGLSVANISVTGGTVNLASYSPLTITTSLSQSAGTMTLPDNFTTSSFTLSGGTLTPGSGTLTFSSAVTISGTPTITSNFGTVILSGTAGTFNCNNVANFMSRLTLVSFAHTGAKIITNCSLPLGANPTIPASVTLNASTLSGSGRLTSSTLGFASGTVALSGFGDLTSSTLSVTGATVNLSALSSVTLATGNFSMSAGSFTSPSGALTLPGNLTISGGIFATTSTTTVVLSSTIGTAIDCGVGAASIMTMTSGSKFVFNNTNTTTISSNCNASKPIVVGSNPTLLGGGIITNNGFLAGSGILTKDSGAMTFNSTAGLSGFSGLALVSMNVLGGTLDLSSYSSVAITDMLYETSGVLTLPSGTTLSNVLLAGGTLNAPAGVLSVSGGLIVRSGTFNANGGTVSLVGNEGSIACTSNVFNKVTFNNSGLKIIQPGCTVPLGSDPILFGTGAVAVGGTLSGTGILTKSQGSVVVNANAAMTGFSSYKLPLVNVNDGLIGYWPFDESSGTTVADKSPLANTMTLSGGPTFSSDVPSGTLFPNSGSIRFTGNFGTNQWGGVTSQLSNAIGQNMTVSAWAKADDASGVGEILRTDGVNGGYFMRILGGRACFEINDGAIHELCGSTILTSGTWAHIAATYNGTTLRLYVNGMQDAQATYSGPILSSNTPIAIGNATTSGGFEHFVGYIDELRIYSRVLSGAEIAALSGGQQYTSSGSAYTLSADLQTNGSLTISTGATLDVSASNYGLTINGDWINNSGTLVPRSGMVTLDGSSRSVLGSTTFYNLRKTTTTADTLTFGAGSTQTVLSTLTLSGQEGQLLSLRSSATPSQWMVNANATDLKYLSVKDSVNTASNPILADGSILSAGNNVNWLFASDKNDTQDTSVPTTQKSLSSISPGPTVDEPASASELGPDVKEKNRPNPTKITTYDDSSIDVKHWVSPVFMRSGCGLVVIGTIGFGLYLLFKRRRHNET